MSYVEWTPLEYTTFTYSNAAELVNVKSYVKDLFAKCVSAGLIREFGMSDTDIDDYVLPADIVFDRYKSIKIGDCTFSTPVGTGQTTFSDPDENGYVRITGGTYPTKKIYVKFDFGLYSTGGAYHDEPRQIFDLYIDTTIYYESNTVISFNTYRYHAVEYEPYQFSTATRKPNSFKAFINMNNDGLYINLSPILFGASDSKIFNGFSINKLNFGVDIFNDYCAIYSHSSWVHDTKNTSYLFTDETNVYKFAFYVGILAENGFNEIIKEGAVLNYSDYYFINNDQIPIKSGKVSFRYVYNINHKNEITPFNNILSIPLSMPTGLPIEIVISYKGKKVIRTYMCSERDLASPAVYRNIDSTIKNSYFYNIDKISMST